MLSLLKPALLSFFMLTGCDGCGAPEAEHASLPGAAVREARPALPPAAVVARDETRRRFERVMNRAREEALHLRPMGEILLGVAESFVGTPYVAGLLDQPERETLIVTLEGFDCVLYIEAVLAMAQGIALEDYAFEHFTNRVQALRYRGGLMDGYPSRLHYFSEWVADNERRGVVRNITRELGGVALPKTLNFMSSHRKSYKHLADPENYAGIRDMEARLEDLALFYIPEDQIHTVYDRLEPGDIVLAMTDIPGLDATHTGLVYRKPDGGVGFIHASISGAVKISPDLEAYVKGVKAQIGVAVARPVDPRG